MIKPTYFLTPKKYPVQGNFTKNQLKNDRILGIIDLEWNN